MGDIFCFLNYVFTENLAAKKNEKVLWKMLGFNFFHQIIIVQSHFRLG